MDRHGQTKIKINIILHRKIVVPGDQIKTQGDRINNYTSINEANDKGTSHYRSGKTNPNNTIIGTTNRYFKVAEPVIGSMLGLIM